MGLESSCSGKVPELQQLLVQRGFLYGATEVSIGVLRVNFTENIILKL